MWNFSCVNGIEQMFWPEFIFIYVFILHYNFIFFYS